MQEILKKRQSLVEFTAEDASTALNLIMSGEATDAQIGAFLVYLEFIQPTPEILASLSAVLLKYSFASPINCSDIVGTGGDGHNTFNVSTASAIIAAGAGCKVAKHGNRSSSSNCGSADILESLGVDLDIDPLLVKDYFSLGNNDQNNFVFLFAQKWHPALKNVSSIRKQLGIRTIFNILGPLINPFSPKYMVLGVYKKELGLLFAQTLVLLKVEKAWVVHGIEGIDEISPNGKTLVWEISNGNITNFEISPKDFGLKSHSLDSVKGSKQENTRNMTDLLNGKIQDGPLLDFVLLNSAALLYVSGLATDLKNGVQIAKDSIYTGKAYKAFQEFRDLMYSNKIQG